MHRHRIGIVSLVALALAGSAVCVQAAEVAGVARDAETGAALGFVTVQIRGVTRQGGDISRGAMSPSDGRFFVASIPLGRYSVRFSRIGYAAHEDSLLVSEERTYELDVSLRPAPIEVEEIVIDADRYAATREVQTGFVALDAERLSQLPGIAEGDPIRTLQLQPGVQAASDFSSGLYVRGGGPDQTLVLLDDVTIYNPTHAFGFFSTFNADALGEINLYKGAYPADHGGRLGALLDVHSREGNRGGLRGRGGVSTIASRLSMDGPVAGGSWMASARRTHLEPLLGALRNRGKTVPDYYFYDINADVTVPVAGGRASVGGYTGSDRLDLAIGTDNSVTLDWGNTAVFGAFSKILRESVLGKLQVSRSRYNSESTGNALTTPIAFTNQITDITAAGTLTWEAGAHRVSGGASVSSYDMRFEQRFNNDTQVDYHKEPVEVAAYAEDRWRISDATIVQAGLRTRYIDDGDRLLWEPRLATTRALNGQVRIKLGGGIYHQYLQLISTEGLSAADFYVPLDRTVSPGRSWQVVAGVEVDPSPGVRASLEGYYTDLSDLVALNTSVAADQEIANAQDLFYTKGTGYATGVELLVQRNIGALTGWAGYTLGWTRRTFEAINDGNEFPPKYDRRHDLNVVGQYRRGKWLYGASFIYATGQGFTPAAAGYLLGNPATGEPPSDLGLLPAAKNSARLLPYNRLDVSVARDFRLFGVRAQWSIDVFNLYSRANEWFVQYDTVSTPDGDSLEAEVVHMLPIIPSFGLNFRF